MKDSFLTPQDLALRQMTRRTLLRSCGYGVGSLALGSLLSESLMALLQEPSTDLVNPLLPKPPHFPAKAKSVIFLFMAGAPSQIDLFDPKPKLVEHHMQPIPEELIKGERFAFIKGVPKLLGSPFKFEKVGQAGHQISELLPHLKTVADDLTFIHSMETDQFNHAPAQLYMNTGIQLPGRPSMGSWLTYGLGSENQDLPGFVVLLSGLNNPDGGKSCWGSGFLPKHYQGVELRSKGDPVLFVNNPDGVSSSLRRDSLDALKDLNGMALDDKGDPEIAARIAQYELAYRMQTSVPELMSIEEESAETHQMYGTEPGKESFANNCLLARRMVERGVRFVQLYHRGWDHHGDYEGNSITSGLPKLCKETDQASAALIQDLKQRGMLDDTIVVWAGEFGRTPMNEARNGSTALGRDHHPRAFTLWIAGGGFKKGVAYGQTDELGYNIVENPVHIHDLHATILHQLGLDHTRLTYKYLGRNFRLTDVSGTVINDLLA